MEAGPLPVFGPLYEVRAQRVGFDIATGRIEVALCLNREGPKPALIDRPTSTRSSTTMPAFAVAQRHKSHEMSEIRVTSGPENQMEVIGHDAERIEVQWHELEGLSEALSKHEVVSGVIEQTQSTDATVRDVKG